MYAKLFNALVLSLKLITSPVSSSCYTMCEDISDTVDRPQEKMFSMMCKVPLLTLPLA